jgi:hypothetical protein
VLKLEHRPIRHSPGTDLPQCDSDRLGKTNTPTGLAYHSVSATDKDTVYCGHIHSPNSLSYGVHFRTRKGETVGVLKYTSNMLAVLD